MAILSPNALVSADLSTAATVEVGLISESFGLSSSALAFIQYGLVDRRLAVALVAGVVPFVLAGALLSSIIPEPIFRGPLGLALIVASYLLFSAGLVHEEPSGSDESELAVETDGGNLPNDSDKPDSAGVVTRVNCEGDDCRYGRDGYLERFGNYSVGGICQGLAGFGIGELGIISMLRTKVPARIAIATNHIVVAMTVVLASLVHVFGGGVVPGDHSIDLATTPWNMVVWTVPATVLGGQSVPLCLHDSRYGAHQERCRRPLRRRRSCAVRDGRRWVLRRG